MANVIARTGRPAIVMAPNKTLAAQLYSEFREFFPNNAVEYFVSYYDYYQPEAYVPSRDLFIEKDSSINDHIEQMRLSATKSLLERPVFATIGLRNQGWSITQKSFKFADFAALADVDANVLGTNVANVEKGRVATPGDVFDDLGDR